MDRHGDLVSWLRQTIEEAAPTKPVLLGNSRAMGLSAHLAELSA